MKNKKFKTRKLVQLVIILISFYTLYNCTQEEAINFKNKGTSASIKTINFNNFIQSQLLKESNLKVYTNTTHKSLKKETNTQQFAFLQNYALSSSIKEQKTYSVPVTPLNYTDKKHLYNLVIEKNKKGITNYLLKTTLTGIPVSLQIIVTDDTQLIKDKNTYSRNRDCTFITIENPPTCECGYFSNGTWVQVSTASPGSTSTTMLCEGQGAPIKASFHNNHGASQGGGGGASVSTGAYGAAPGPVYVYSSQEERCYPDGTCTPPLYIPATSTPSAPDKVPGSEEDIVDNTDNPCVSDIIKALQEKDQNGAMVPDLKGKEHLSQVILDLFGNCKNYDLVIKIDDLGLSPSGNLINAYTDGFDSITLDEDLVKDATQLSIAKTLIHESLHAYINFKLDPRVRDFDIITLLKGYYKRYNYDPNVSQHNFMAEYIEALAYSLSAYDNHKQDMEYYKQLSWGGLEASDNYQSLPTTEQTAIQNTIANERFNRSGKKSTKCDN
ncbi:hypothetical protein [Tenacibaculum sp. 190524A02b]|uniref:hypothetical protein n=1 Tax=Tenacibaculum vairaonense TaxID=3137860 RepID=UPI0031FAB8C8